MRKLFRIAGTLLAVTLPLLAGAASIQAAPPAAGTTITNTATATYFHAALGVLETVRSNTVSATVLPVPALSVTGGGTLRLGRGTEGIHAFRIRNTGNVPLRIDARIAEIAGDDFDVTGTLYHDEAGNGVVDSTDPQVAGTLSGLLAPGDSIPVLYMFLTPGTVSQDDRADSVLSVTADPEGGGDALTGTAEAVTLIDVNALRLAKRAAYNAETNRIAYTLNLRNNGETDVRPYAEIDGESIVIDGAARSVVLVRDPIPLNTTFVSVGATGSLDPVYHVLGDPAQTYVTEAPADLSQVDALAFVTDETYAVGSATDMTFTVAVNDNVGDVTIQNLATTYLDDGTQIVSTISNEVETPITGEDGTLTFFDPTFDNPIEDTRFDEDVAVELVAGVCNVSRRVDQVRVTVTTALSGDRETLVATETGPNTGVFRTDSLTVRQSPVAIPESRVLEPLENDRVAGTATCNGTVLEDAVTVDPGGYVFDALTNEPVEGAVVELFAIGQGGALLQTVRTASNGFFAFDRVERGTYRIQVTPPPAFSAPSVNTQFDGFGRRVDPRASYGVIFTFDGGPLTDIDVPVDPTDILPLVLNKSASRAEARRGEYVVYTLEARNRTGQGVLDAMIEDTLPPGFAYVDGSAMRDGEGIDDPQGAPGPALTFDLDLLTPDEVTEIEYAVRILPTAGQGRRTNTAILSGRSIGGAPVASQTARAIVRVDDRGGVFADEAVVIGRIFLDTNGDGVQTDDEVEPGIPGVKIVTSNGLSVVTDEHGRYSLFGLRPVTQVFAVQKSTLPEGAEIALAQADDTLRPGSRLIDLKRGELRGEDFPVVWTEGVARAVEARRAEFDAQDYDEALLRDDLPLTFDGGVQRLSSRTENALDTSTDVDRRRQADVAQDGDAAAEATERRVETQAQREARLEALIPTLSKEFGFVDLPDGAVTDYPILDVLVKSPPKGALKLTVNGETIPDTRIGAKLTGKSVQLYEYVAVPLAAGANTVTATLTDPFGNERGSETRTVYAPGAPAGLQVIAPDSVPGNASARVPVVVRVVDAEGRLVRAPATVTLTAEKGTWDVRDIRSQVGGLQAFIDNGEATFDFIPPNLVGRETLRVEAEFGAGEAAIGVTPDLGERILVGVIEGAVRLGDGKGADLDGLMDDEELSSFEETTEGVRGQLYLKGRILGENLLTLRYDSDQDTDERLFRDIRRDEFYPVYGDNSEYGFDAQSSSKLFVKVERGQSYILYGDIAVEPEADAIRLGAFRRSLTGVKGRYQDGPVSVTVFAAETELDQRVVEFGSRGVSGPYDVALDGLRDGSEIVEIITRDRDQPARIIDVLPQTRLSDYSIDYFSGALLFNRPIPLTDDALNPISIRVTYETEDGAGEKYFVYGGEASYAITEDITVGYRELRTTADRDNEERRTVRSAYVDAQVGDGHTFDAEITQSVDDGGSDAFGYRASYGYKGERGALSVEAARTDEGFDLPGSYIAEGRDELRATGQYRIDSRTDVTADALYTNDNTGDRERYGAELRVNRAVTDTLDASLGLRAVRTETADERTDVLSGIAGLRYRPAQLPGASLLLEFEQDFVEVDNWRLTAGADYQWRPEVRLYALNELSTTESGYFGIGDGRSTNFTTKFGAEVDVTENISGFSEYRDGGTGGGGGAGNGLANGARGDWTLTETTTVRASIEHLEPLLDGQERRSAVTLAADYDNEARGILARADLEWDRNPDGYGLFSNLAFGYRVDQDFTLLLRNRFAFDDKGRFDRIRDRLRFGVAYRPVKENRARLLGWYEYEIDEAERREQTHRWSLGGTWTQSDRLRLDARYAGEYTEFHSPTVDDSNTLHMLRAGAEYDFADDRLALAGNVALFTDAGMENYTLGLGAEIKATVAPGVQLGLGYNHVDLEEDRIRDLYRSGFYIRGKIKLDDSLWDAFDGFRGDVVGE